MTFIKSSGRVLKYGLIIFVVLFIVLFFVQKALVISPPDIKDKSALNYPLEVKGDSLVFCGDSWLHTNSGGVSELYIKGAPFEMGVKNGKLTQELAGKQEKYFFDFIETLIPSKATLQYLKYFIAYFNKDLDDYISLDLRKEIYGISLYASDDFDYVGEKYQRILNYHAAHDIGHTIQNMNLVNCTAFSVQNEYTSDSTLMIGRNLDFSAGDNFAKEKLVVFCHPDSGYKFAYVSWGGMVGVLSGMNEHGLIITLNSAKSGIPLSAKTPVSLISREVLQYAKNIDEAYSIINKHNSFVSESFFIGSALDNKAVVIEKSLDSIAMYDSKESKLVLTNHFQSDKLKSTELNLEAINEGCTLYRLERTHELIDSMKPFDIQKIVDVLRDRNGKDNQPIGLGNESAVNQFICHHSIVFNPSKRLMWVSKYPYQENDFYAYDLNVIFSDTFDVTTQSTVVDSLQIASSDFYNSGGVNGVWQYREMLDSIQSVLTTKKETRLSDLFITKFENANPDFYLTHYVLSQYYERSQEYQKAFEALSDALSCQIPRLVDKQQILKRMEFLKKEGYIQ